MIKYFYLSFAFAQLIEVKGKFKGSEREVKGTLLIALEEATEHTSFSLPFNFLSIPFHSFICES